ncbi:hypothetical protein [Paucibacter soli]|uniref:hypothetical protein n=1 Tax=Paucibacter soli TaxID=3133433 RepID=UPI0030B5F6FB
MSDLTPKEIADAVERHLAAPEVSVADYLRTLMSQAASEIKGRCKLYLDTRYWVFLRDAELGRAKKPEHEAILLALRDRVASGVAICPVSDVAFMEMTAQTDAETRMTTAKLWDELSLGVSLQTEQGRVRTELEQYYMYPSADDVPIPLRDLVWTKPCFVLGATVPHFDEDSADVNEAFRKASLDALWATTFSELANESSAVLAMSERFQRTADAINAEMRKFQHEIPSFEKAFLVEVSGAINANQKLLAEVVLQQFIRQGNSLEGMPERQVRTALKTKTSALTNVFRLRRDLMARRLPTLYIHAMCHAAIRMDVKRKINGNFLRDIHHGNAGVAYHDAVFTEKPLKVLLTAGNVTADKTFGCRVMSDEREVRAYLEGM